MIPNEQIKLLEAWKKQLFEELSISEIMSISDKKTKPWVFNALKLLTKYNLLIARRKANINLYKLNLSNPFLIQTLQYLDAQNSLDFSHLGIIQELIAKIPIKDYCLLAFDYRRKERLDICFLIENKEMEKKVKPYLNEVKNRLYINSYYLIFDDFVRMLLSKEENIAKRIFASHLLLFNADIYYQLIKEAYKKGFSP